MTSRRLAVLGGGGHGRVVADCALECGWLAIDVFDDDPAKTMAGPFAVVGTGKELLVRHGDYDGVVVAIGDNCARLVRLRALEAVGARLTALVHPRAFVSRHARLGLGAVVIAGAVVNVGASLGPAVIINTGATVDHDCDLGPGVHVSPGAHLAGTVQVGAESWIGAGAVVRESVTIGNRVCIGAGAVVVKSIADNLTVVGNPARLINR